MQDQNNHKQDKLTLRLTTLIFVLCFLIPVVYTLVTGKCIFNTCALNLECLKSFVAEKDEKSSSCPLFDKQTSSESVCSSSAPATSSVQTGSPAPQSLPVGPSEDSNKSESKLATVDENQQKTFKISG